MVVNDAKDRVDVSIGVDIDSTFEDEGDDDDEVAGS